MHITISAHVHIHVSFTFVATFTNALAVVFPGKESTLVMQDRTQTKVETMFFSEPDQSVVMIHQCLGNFRLFGVS